MDVVDAKRADMALSLSSILSVVYTIPRKVEQTDLSGTLPPSLPEETLS